MNWLFEHLDAYQPFFWCAFALTVFSTPLAAMLARRWGVLDMPDKTLKPHARPTPYLGGIAIAVGWAAALVWAIVSQRVELWLLLPLLLGGLAMSAMGLLDDLRNLSPKLRLILQSVIILSVLVATGTGRRLVDSIAIPLGWQLPDAFAVTTSMAISLVIVLGACNSTNLIDGLDGLCTGVTAIISLGFFLLAAKLATYKPDEPTHPVRLVLAISMLGATLGFLPLNFNPARIFMGDAGSVLLGFNCGMMILLFVEWGNLRWMIGAMMIFALPMFDTALAMFRRWRSGRSIFAGDRSHFYDQLVQRGLSVRQTVLISYALTLFYALLGLLVLPNAIRTRYALLIFLGVSALTALVVWWAGMTHPEALAERRAARSTGPGDKPPRTD